MSEQAVAPMESWLVAPMDDEVSDAVRRLRRAPDVQRVAVMPDVHLARDVCVGVAVATSELIYPQAVGGDIGCGMLAIPFDVEATVINEPRTAGRILACLGNSIPARRRHKRRTVPMPADLASVMLSDPRLEGLWNTTGVLEFATLGSGNHFVELQADETERLWLMVHSGSRGLGPAIRDHHLAQGDFVGGGLRCLRSGEASGVAYLGDAGLARRFADENRRQIALLVEQAVLGSVGSGHLQWAEAITTDHNHVVRETHAGLSDRVGQRRPDLLRSACAKATRASQLEDISAWRSGADLSAGLTTSTQACACCTGSRTCACLAGRLPPLQADPWPSDARFSYLRFPLAHCSSHLALAAA